MSSDWIPTKLGDVGNIITGTTPRTTDKKNYSSADYNFYKPSDLVNNYVKKLDTSENFISEYAFRNTRQIPSGALLVTCVGTIGNIGITTKLSTCNQQINAIIPNENIDVRFLGYSILSMRPYLQHIANAPVVPIINKSNFSNIPIAIPPLPIQHQIVAELDALNTIMDKKRAQLEELDKLAQATFYHMFGDPVHNEKGWEVKKFDSFSNVKSSRRVFIEDCVEEGIPFYRGTEISVLSKGESVTSKLYITQEHYDRLKEDTGIPKIGDLLLPSICSDGEVWRVDSNEPFYFKDGRVIWVELLDKTINSHFLQFSFSQMLKNNFSSIASGTTFKEMKIFLLKALEIPIPPLTLQTQFAQKIEHIEKQKALIERSIADVQQLFDYTMDRYFS